ncbi:hydrophobic surface binding protein B [Nannizzia gypsea CBS 118893]|uniref:Hydrophobic surface binding protein B n=1 Tax=Arthroderma gypseum (strain ATCC MYA-4604 / CBS 118893) TaxID=535722 RepID=E4UUY6_ARTGP|nr:hydrophobic surface binding protein B [Nannizzia gypsea CBS 118893]EFR01103.1 hydrophobic surface binding protein B [Nannizzia gypsea CBS 118893]
MKLSSIFAAVVTALATTVVAAPLAKRDGAAVVNAVSTISQQITDLDNVVKTYNGGFITPIKIQTKTSKLTSGLKDAIKTVQESAKFNDQESQAVATAFVQLKPKIDTVLASLVSKQPIFKKGILGIIPLDWLVKINLKKQKDLSAKLGDETVLKLNEQFAKLAPLINNAIAEAFTKAIAAFS